MRNKVKNIEMLKVREKDSKEEKVLLAAPSYFIGNMKTVKLLL